MNKLIYISAAVIAFVWFAANQKKPFRFGGGRSGGHGGGGKW